MSRPFLLVLPHLPPNSGISVYRNSYEHVIRQCFQNLEDSRCKLLFIAVEISESTCLSRSYPEAQSILAQMYRLCTFITTESQGGSVRRQVEYVVILLDTREVDGRPAAERGPIFSAGSANLVPSEFSQIFSSGSREGQRVLKLYLKRQNSSQQAVAEFVRVIGNDPKTLSVEQQTVKSNIQGGDALKYHQHESVLVGGTFDHLHDGHRLLLSAFALIATPSTVSKPSVLTIGITGDELLVNKKFAQVMESWDERQNAVERFLKLVVYGPMYKSMSMDVIKQTEKVVNGRRNIYHSEDGFEIRCVLITDPYGPSITEQQIKALTISGETRSGGAAVNAKRQELQWPDLAIYEVNVLDANITDDQKAVDDFTAKLSSTEIRKQLSEKSSSL